MQNTIHHHLLLLTILLLPSIHGYKISKKFETYLISRYGDEVAKSIYRPDINRGSLGGGNHTSGSSTKRIPVIFIHGMGGKAGDYYSIHKEFHEAGYTLSELYAITWGTPLAIWTTVHFQCEFVLQIRRFLESVSDFTNSKVDVIGYSMGSPLLRKAILGGRCVDNPEVDLGPPITSRIQTFLSVGGANYGSHLCSSTLTEMCNAVTGMNCNSSFIRDINSRTAYEGSELFAIFNPKDEWIGDTSVCNIPPYTLQGAEYHQYPISFHYSVLWKSKELQVELIERKYAVGDLLTDMRKLHLRPIPSSVNDNSILGDIGGNDLTGELDKRSAVLHKKGTKHGDGASSKVTVVSSTIFAKTPSTMKTINVSATHTSDKSSKQTTSVTVTPVNEHNGTISTRAPRVERLVAQQEDILLLAQQKATR